MRIIQAHRKRVVALALSAGGLLASAGQEATLKFWQLPLGELSGALECSVKSLDFVCQGELLAVLTIQKQALTVNPQTKDVRHLLGRSAEVTWLGPFPNAESSLAIQGTRGFLGFAVSRVAFRTGFPMRVAHVPRPITLAALAHHLPLIACYESRYSLTIRDLSSLEVRAVLRHRPTEEALAFSVDDRYLAAATGNEVVVWATDGFREAAQLAYHRNQVRALAFTPDGRTLLTAALDGRVAAWDVPTWQLRGAYDWSISRLRCLALAPDGMTAAVGGDTGQVVVWDLED
jgi:WD40 repeat protein